MLCIPPPNILQPLIDRPFANRPFVFSLDDINKASICDHLFEQRSYDNSFSEFLGGLNRKFAALVEDVIGRNGFIIGSEDGIDLGVLNVSSRSKVASGREFC